MAICEALILEGTNSIETQSHDLKIFNYDPARRLFYVLVYFKGGTNKFLDSWKSYCEVVEDFIVFPENYSLSGVVEPLEIGEPHDCIRMGSTLQGAETKIYHLFINVNYRLALLKKKVGKNRPSKKNAKK